MALRCADGTLERPSLGPELRTEVGAVLVRTLGTRLVAAEGAFDANTVGS